MGLRPRISVFILESKDLCFLGQVRVDSGGFPLVVSRGSVLFPVVQCRIQEIHGTCVSIYLEVVVLTSEERLRCASAVMLLHNEAV